MDGNRPTAADQLDTWRAEQRDRLDPVRFAFLEALQRRTRDQQGALRRVLEARLETLLQDYAGRIPAAPPVDATPVSAVRESLATLTVPREGQPASSYPDLPALADFRARWATLRTESQVRQTLAQTPSDGGPLNSSVLVHRAIGWMGEVSPGYLQHFLAYVDNLAWLETMQQRGTLPSRDAAPGGKPRRTRTAR